MGEVVLVSNGCGGVGGGGGSPGEGKAEGQQQGQLLALVLATLRKSVVLPCQMADADDPAAGGGWGMEISWPTDVRHVAHVTFDRLNGFLGLPVEFELEIPGHVPSASASVFGVSPESMQCGYDDKGNSMPKILLLMQERLYAQDGLKAEGIFRITPENSQEEHVREQLNRGVVPEDIDVHCLASLIKAWFRELPVGVLDSLSPEQVLHCNTEEKCVELVKLLPPTQTALLSWVVELMADVVQEEESNKMNARNVAMVFAPNMTQMSDPLTALMHAVQVMNFLKTLILKTLREREDDDEGSYSTFSSSPTLCDELDEVNHHDQQDDENDRDIEKYSGGGSESPKDIDKAAKPEVDNEQLIGASRRHTSIDFHLCDELDEVNHHDQQDDENDRDIEKYSGGGSESPKDIDKAAKPEVDNEQLIGASRRHTSIDFHLYDELDEVNHHDQQDDENDRDIEKYSGGGSESPKDIDKAAKPEVDNEQLICASRRHTSIDFHLCDELDEVNHHDQQDDENDRDIEKYSGGGSESPKDIDKAAKPEEDNEQLICASRRHTSIDFHSPYISYSSDDKDVPLNDIEECFLRRLESKAVSKGADENNGSNLVTSNKAAEQLSSSESINGSCKRNDQTSNMKDAVDTKSNEVKDVTKGELILCS